MGLAGRLLVMSSDSKNKGNQTSTASSKALLARLEREAYSSLISAFAAQGELSWKKEQSLLDVRNLLHIPDDYHRLEMQRILHDENLNKISSSKPASSRSKKASESSKGSGSQRSEGGSANKKGNNALAAYAFPPTNNQPAILSKLLQRGPETEKEEKTTKRTVKRSRASTDSPSRGPGGGGTKRKRPRTTSKKDTKSKADKDDKPATEEETPPPPPAAGEMEVDGGSDTENHTETDEGEHSQEEEQLEAES
uniref:ENT domain-containing protein n=1 Tax=Paramoeba aestuarina TaxID=180227 RepID=A0A7S4PFI8_9EUKA